MANDNPEKKLTELLNEMIRNSAKVILVEEEMKKLKSDIDDRLASLHESISSESDDEKDQSQINA